MFKNTENMLSWLAVGRRIPPTEEEWSTRVERDQKQETDQGEKEANDEKETQPSYDTIEDLNVTQQKDGLDDTLDRQQLKEI